MMTFKEFMESNNDIMGQLTNASEHQHERL